MKKSVYRFIVLAIGLSMLSLSACSRQEKPKTSDKPKVQETTNAVEKPIRSITLAPTPAGEVPRNPAVTTSPKEIVRMGPKEGLIDTIPSHPKMVSSPEREQALMERQKAFGKKVVEEQLAKAQVVYSRELQDLERKEIEVREKDPAVRVAYAGVKDVQFEYEEACKQSIPGYADLIRSASQLRTRLDEAFSRRNQGLTVDAQELSDLRNKLNKDLSSISQMRREANVSDPAIGQTLLKVQNVQSSYEQALLLNDEYMQVKRKSDQTSAVINNLTSKQGY